MNFGEQKIKAHLREMESLGGKYRRRMLHQICLLGVLVLVWAAAAGIAVGAGMIKGIIDLAPQVSLADLEPQGFATQIYDSQGNLTETLVMSGANREEASYEEFPEHLVQAFVSMEDRRFWEHNGIDLRSIMRAAAGILTGDYAGGGSTITQQLVKNNVLAGGSETSWGARLERKLQEQYLAVKLEQSSQMSKEETKKWILTNYLNSINLGNNTLGVKTAARRYFDKELGELSLEECSVLAAITSNPSRYNPISHPEQNQARRQIVLQYMEDLGYISGEEREAALSEEVYEEIRTVNQRVGENTPYSYFTDELIRQVQRELVERLGYTDSEAYSLLYSG